MADDGSASQDRVEVAALLGRMESARSDIERAAGHATGRAAQALAAIAARLAGKEHVLAQALQTGSSSTDIEFSAIDGLIQSSESAAGAAELAGEAEAGSSAAEAALAATTAASRSEERDLAHDLFDGHLFAHDLRFASAADEADYHKREVERQRRIAADLAHGTPEDVLNAGGLEAGQMLDAGTHGATADPAFMPRWNRLVAQLDRQREAVRSKDGVEGAAAFDQQVREDLKAFLQSKHVPAEQIAQVLAAKDPLQAVTPYLQADDASRLQSQLTTSAVDMASAAPPQVTAPHLSKATIAAAGDLAQAALALQSAGVTAEPATTPSHGLPNQARSATTSQQAARG